MDRQKFNGLPRCGVCSNVATMMKVGILRCRGCLDHGYMLNRAEGLSDESNECAGWTAIFDAEDLPLTY